MTKVEIYTKFTCPFCVRAKHLLNKKNVEFSETDITMNAQRRAEMEEKVPGARTVPQIIINGQPIGGCDELYALENTGELDALLAGNA